MDEFLYTASLLQKMLVDPSMGTLNILSLYFNVATSSTEFFIAVKSEPNVDVSTLFFLLLCHIIGTLLQNISIPIMDLLVVLSPEWLASTKQCVKTYLPLGIGISKGIGSQASIIWHSKRKNGVETSTFGSELTAMKNSVELIVALRYKLMMFGVPIDGSTNIFCDNEAVYKNSSTLESKLRNKHHSISYHMSREAVASCACRMSKEDTETKLSNLFTKVIPRSRRELFFDSSTY